MALKIADALLPTAFDLDIVICMLQKIGYVPLFVKDYDEALQFYTDNLGFISNGDMPMGEGLRWITVLPSADAQTGVTFMLAQSPEQEALVGHQGAGVPIMTLNTDDVAGDFERLSANGICFMGEPKENPYGTDVVFEDLYGNLIDLVQLAQ